MKNVMITEMPSPDLAMIRYPWIVATGKFKNQSGFAYQFTSKEAFEDFVNHGDYA